MQIDEKSNINMLLKEYPQLEDFLITLNPKYKKLKNPILRKTVGKVATLTQVAIIGGYKPIELVNMLRDKVGQEKIDTILEEEKKSRKPEWADENAVASIDANELLDRDKNPMAESTRILKKLNRGELLEIRSDFIPEPLIEHFENQGKEVWCEESEQGLYKTVVKN